MNWIKVKQKVQGVLSSWQARFILMLIGCAGTGIGLGIGMFWLKQSFFTIR